MTPSVLVKQGHLHLSGGENVCVPLRRLPAVQVLTKIVRLLRVTHCETKMMMEKIEIKTEEGKNIHREEREKVVE
ncbi:MAG: hypothetical protein AB1728_12300 [Bacteroidota bacterium]